MSRSDVRREKAQLLLGKTFVDNTLDQIILRIGRVTYTRDEAVNLLGVGNFRSAITLSRLLDLLDITTVQQLYKVGPHALARVRGVGHTTIWVAMCVLEHNSYSVTKWWGWNKETGVKFSTLKHHEMAKVKKRGAHYV